MAALAVKTEGLALLDGVEVVGVATTLRVLEGATGAGGRVEEEPRDGHLGDRALHAGIAWQGTHAV